MKEFTIALIGNPNSGKTSLFNALTGSKQQVGNWPGVTVERKEGLAKYKGQNIRIIDLPGTYSLSASSEDEIIAVNYILNEKPDAIINVVDAGNIERNLYLTLQLLEMNSKVVLALNMIDEAEKRNIFINKEKLSALLSIPVVPTVATRNIGIHAILQAAWELDQEKKPLIFDYEQVGGDTIKELAKTLVEEGVNKNSAYLLSLKLLENDRYAQEFVKLQENPLLQELVETGREKIKNKTGFDAELSFADQRYKIIRRILEQSVRKEDTGKKDLTERIDRVVTNKWFGIPCFFLVMFLLYQIAMGFGDDFLGGYVETGFALLGEYVAGLMVNSPALLRSFIVDALIGGVGAVLVFVPLMLVLFFLITFLEDTGYMARAAYVMDRLMNALGLHGKTTVAMIIGSGCNVAGIMSTRTLESKKDRMIGILTNSFVSCGGRLPVYALFAGAFFGGKKIGFLTASGLVFFSLYILGIIVAVAAGKVLSKTLFKQEKSYFILELPPYRFPTLKNLLSNMWEKTYCFIKRAGTVIFAIVTLIWVLSVFPMGVEPGSSESILGLLGSLIAPVFSPAGFGNWEAAVALIVGIGAKEAVVATFGMVYGTGETMLTAVITQYFTPLSAYAFMVMTLLYIPCAATIATIKKETDSVRWALFSVAYSLVIGWVAAVLVYQVGTLLGL